MVRESMQRWLCIIEEEDKDDDDEKGKRKESSLDMPKMLTIFYRLSMSYLLVKK